MTPEKIEGEPETKVCTKCEGEPQPIDNFKIDKRETIKGLVYFRRGACLVCERERNRKANQRLRAGLPATRKKYTPPDLLVNDDNKLICEMTTMAWR